MTTPSFRKSSNHTSSFRKIPVPAEPRGPALQTGIILAGFLLASSYFGFRFGYLPVDLLPRKLAERLDLIKDPPFPIGGPLTKVAERNELPSVGSVYISVDSYPAGAVILKNGLDTGLITSAKIQVEVNQDIKIGLKKAGYIPFEKNERIGKTSASYRYSLILAPTTPQTLPINSPAGAAPVPAQSQPPPIHRDAGSR